jgi:hypothetical protein
VTLSGVLQVMRLCRGTIENEHISLRSKGWALFGRELVIEEKEEIASFYGWTT